MIRTPKAPPPSLEALSLEAQKPAVAPKKKVKAAPLVAPPVIKAVTAENVAMDHGGSTVSVDRSALGIKHQAIAASGKLAPAPTPAAQAKALEGLAGEALDALNNLDFKEVQHILEDAGIQGPLRMGPVPPELSGPELQVHRLEWFLGQLQALLASGELSGRWAGGVDTIALDFKHAPFGTDLIERFRANDAQETKDLKAFVKEQAQAGRVSDDSEDFQKIFGSSWFDAHALKGRTGAFLFLDWDKGGSKVLEGVVDVVPSAGGNAPFRLKTKHGDLDLNINDVKRYAIVDELPAAREALRAAAKAEGMLKSSSPEAQALFGSWFDAGALAGRQVRLLEYDAQSRTFAAREGKIAVDPQSMGAAYRLETAGGTLSLNANHLQELWIEDRSDVPLSKLSAKAKKEGYARSEGWLDPQALLGKSVWLVVLDAAERRYRLEAGVVRPDPKALGPAQFLLDQKDGLRAMNSGNVKQLWVKE